MKTIKKAAALTIAATMAIGLVACGTKKDGEDKIHEIETLAPEVETPVIETEAVEIEIPSEDAPAAPTEGVLDGGADIEVESSEEFIEETMSEEQPDVTEDVVASADWKDYTLTIEDAIYTLPIAYSEFKAATGWTIKETEEMSWLEPNQYTVCTLKTADGVSIASIDILNTSAENAAVADGIIISISQYDSHVSKTGIAIGFAGLKIGDVTSTDELIAKFGEPTKRQEYRAKEDEPEMTKYETDTLRWCEDATWTTDGYLSVEVNIHTGLIEEFTLDAPI